MSVLYLNEYQSDHIQCFYPLQYNTTCYLEVPACLSLPAPQAERQPCKQQDTKNDANSDTDLGARAESATTTTFVVARICIVARGPRCCGKRSRLEGGIVRIVFVGHDLSA